VRLKKELARNEAEARKLAEELLNDNNFASDNNGFFGSSKADWFVIGGRWSGELARLKMKGDFYKEAHKLIPPKSEWGYSSADTEKLENQKKWTKLWNKMGGIGIDPFTRDSYRNRGYEDDAMICTEAMFKKLKKYRETEVVLCSETGYIEEEMLISNTPKTEIVGQWLVVIDYHS
jgi:hypothetical protein